MFGCGVLVVGMAACGQQEESPPAEPPGDTNGQPPQGEQDESPDGQSPAEHGDRPGEHRDVQRGTLQRPDGAENAYTYDPAAPEGAELVVTTERNRESTEMNLEATGLEPDRGYAVHAHENPCGPTGDDAGPHFQHEEDPAATEDDPSTDPEYANPRNEIWLDTHTDAEGNARAHTEVPFTFQGRAPHSVVVHEEEHTQTEPGSAGEAGDRVACIDLPER